MKYICKTPLMHAQLIKEVLAGSTFKAAGKRIGLIPERAREIVFKYVRAVNQNHDPDKPAFFIKGIREDKDYYLDKLKETIEGLKL